MTVKLKRKKYLNNEPLDDALRRYADALKNAGIGAVLPGERIPVGDSLGRVTDRIDMGKPISDMVGVDLPMCIETVQYFAECIDKVTGTVTATEYDVMSTVLRERPGNPALRHPDHGF